MESDRRVFAWGLVRALIREVQDCAKASASASSRHFAVARVPSRQRARSWRPPGALNSSPDVEGFQLPGATNLSRIVPGGAMDRRHVTVLRLAAAITFIAGIGGAAYIFPTHATKVACALNRSGCWVAGPGSHIELRVALFTVSSVVAAGLAIAARARAREIRPSVQPPIPRSGRPKGSDPRGRPTKRTVVPPNGEMGRGGTCIEPGARGRVPSALR